MESNPFWDQVCKIADAQREKGLKKYGMELEFNDMDIIERLTYLEEELVDGLMYIEWAKEYLRTQAVSREQYKLCYDECLNLRRQNEFLMDTLRSYEDDGK